MSAKIKFLRLICLICLGIADRAFTVHSVSLSNLENNVTSYLKYVGNPFRERFSAPRLSYARNVWDMEVFDGRLYFGHGNSNNRGPARNAGPIEVWYYDPDTDSFAYDYVIQEEQLERFRVIGDTLYIPGHDPTGSPSTSNIYRFKDGVWSVWDNIPAIHVYDVYQFDRQIYAALGIREQYGKAVSVSDDGQTWRLQELPTAPIPYGSNFGVFRAFEFVDFNNQLLVSVLDPVRDVVDIDVDAQSLLMRRVEPPPPTIYRLTATGEWEAIDQDFFPDFPLSNTNYLPPRMARTVTFASHLMYVGASIVTDHNWTPYALLSADENYEIVHHRFQDQELAWDMIVEDSTLYILLAQQSAHEDYRVRVVASCDLSNWREVFRFDAESFSRSFALYQGDFYFGQGTEVRPVERTAGDILRLSHEHFELGC